MKIRTLPHQKLTTKNEGGEADGFLVRLYNNDGFFQKGKKLGQVYLTTILPQKIKVPHPIFIEQVLVHL